MTPQTDAAPTNQRGKVRNKRQSLQAPERRAGYGMLTPSLLVIGAVTLFPILYSMWMSLNHISLTVNGFSMNFAGLQNYSLVIHSETFWHSVWFTFYFAVVTVFLELFLGMLIALAINGIDRLKNVSVVIMLIPWSLITVVSAQMWGYIYNGVYGVLNYLLQSLHLIGAPVTWLGTGTSAVMAMMVADIWKTTPFVVIIILAGLQMVPRDLYESAYLDGANAWHVFWSVTFPMVRGSIALAGLFRILQAFGMFDLPYVLTQGGPGTATESLSILGDRVMFQNLDFGPGSAVAVCTVILVLALSLVFLSAFRNLVREGESE
ncbi:sugar ABC transporter permease [Alicyclobacillaceae bacterium I2511]|nr:sugar ABC transporter permease [Alicyclobacillaceae bacterium I2511]